MIGRVRRLRHRCLVAVLVLASACAGTSSPSTAPTTGALARPTTTAQVPVAEVPVAEDPGPDTTTPTTPVRSGADRLVEDDFDVIAGLRVGLIVNQTAVVDGVHLIDHVDQHPAVELVAVFAPEHGVRGVADAGEAVGDTVDSSTGVEIFSLYGSTRAPTAEMLAEVDVLVYDLQDVGARFYTYVSTLGLAMQAANRHDIRFVVLDRPNPLGGDYIAGFRRVEALASFVGLYPIPAVYGLTAGELASAIVGEQWLDGLDGLDLEIVRVEGWDRSQRWQATGREWIPPSPGLPTSDAALVYSGTVLFEATTLSYGKGTAAPFTTLGAPWVDGSAVAESLNELELPGVRFDPVVFTPDPELAPDPRFSGQECSGVRLVVTDRERFDPMLVGAHALVAFRDHADALGAGSPVDRPEMFDLLAGTGEYRALLDSGAGADDLMAAWQSDTLAFATLRAPYLLY